MKTKSATASLEIAAPAEGQGFQRPGEQGAAELAGTRGVVFVEYVALLLLVTIGGAVAVLSLGVPLVALFRYQQLILSLPIP